MDQDVLGDLRDVTEHLDAIGQGVRNFQALPVWAQAARSFLSYNPESVLYQVQRWMDRLNACMDEEGRIVAMVLAAHRIHRFGAGPAVSPEIWLHVVAAVEHLEHPEDLAEGLAQGPLEPKYFVHAGHARGEWPIRVLPESFYGEGC